MTGELLENSLLGKFDFHLSTFQTIHVSRADPGFPNGGGGGGVRNRLCAHSAQHEGEVLFGWGPGPTQEPWKL